MLTLDWSPRIISLKSQGARFSAASLAGSTLKSALSWPGQRGGLHYWGPIPSIQNGNVNGVWLWINTYSLQSFIHRNIYTYIIIIFFKCIFINSWQLWQEILNQQWFEATYCYSNNFKQLTSAWFLLTVFAASLGSTVYRFIFTRTCNYLVQVKSKCPGFNKFH